MSLELHPVLPSGNDQPKLEQSVLGFTAHWWDRVIHVRTGRRLGPVKLLLLPQRLLAPLATYSPIRHRLLIKAEKAAGCRLEVPGHPTPCRHLLLDGPDAAFSG